MKKSTQKNTGTISVIVTVILFAVLLLLTAALTTVFLAASSEVDAFDLKQVTSGREDADTDITGYFLPEFAGITAQDERYGISFPSSIVSELFRLGAPVIYEILSPEFYAGKLDEDAWLRLSEEKYSVYLRFHERTSLGVLSLYAGLYSGERAGKDVPGYASELLLLPYGDSVTYENGIIRIAVRDSDGQAYLYVGRQPDSILAGEDLVQTVSSYQTRLKPFVFAGDDYPAASPTEPVFMSTVNYRDIIIMEDTASLLAANAEESEKLLRVFDINPDKLLTSHTDVDGTRTFVDTQGMLSVGKSDISYRSTTDGGIRISELTGVSAEDTAYSIRSYIGASVLLWSRIRDIGESYVGQDSDLQLSGISYADGAVTVKFSYAVDNLRIMTGRPAFSAVFENGILRSAQLHTIAVLNLGTRGQSANEWWFYRTLDGISAQNVTLVYRAVYASPYSVDYDKDAIGAQWAAITVPAEERRDR